MKIHYSFPCQLSAFGQSIVSVLERLTSKAHVEVVASHPPDLILCCTEVRPGVMDILRTLNGELPIGQSIPRVPRGRDVILTSVVGNLGDLIVRLRIPVSYTFEGGCQGFADNHDAPGLYEESRSLRNQVRVRCVIAVGWGRKRVSMLIPISIFLNIMCKKLDVLRKYINE